jgi:hypothetical protein
LCHLLDYALPFFLLVLFLAASRRPAQLLSQTPIPRGEINRTKRGGEWNQKQLQQRKGKGISSTNLSESSTTTRSCKDQILLAFSFQSDFFPSTIRYTIRSWHRRDEVGFLHPTQFDSLVADGTNKSQHFRCSDHKLAVSTDVLPGLYRAARRAHSDATLNGPSSSPSAAALIMTHSKALLILCPDLLTAWNSR